MKQPSETPSQNRNDSKTLLSTLKWTTAIGAVSLTLAGWGLLSQAEALNASVDQSAAELAGAGSTAALAVAAAPADTAAFGIMPGAITEAVRATATTPVTPTATTKAKAAAATAALPTATAPTPATATPSATATPPAAATPAATATPEKLYTLDVVQWTQNANGEEIAVVRDANGTLWYIWGPDVDRIERGLDPQYQPQAVNATSRSRGS